MNALILRCLMCASMVSLPGCTTISAGFAGSPPGLNKYSFRECLVDDGFLTDTPLVGTSRANYGRRHPAERRPGIRPDVERMGEVEFTARSAEILRRGFFPHQQYGAKARDDRDGYVEAISDPVHNRPYVNNLEGGAYSSGGSTRDVPSAGAPPRLDFPVNRFLDCYLAPVGRDEDAPSTGDYDLEGRVLRAHVLLTMLASFGAELVTTHPGKRQAEEAARLLGHVRDAELALRSASPVMNADLRRMLATTAGEGGVLPAVETLASANGGSDRANTLTLAADRAGRLPMLRWHGYVTRILRVFQVGVDIQVVDANQSLDRVTNIIGAFSTPTPGAFKGVLNDAIKGLATVQRVQLYGTGMRLDGVETLAAHRLEIVADPVDANAATVESWTYNIPRGQRRWGLWDARLEQACARLGGVANVLEASCLPKPDQLKAALAAEMPPVPASTGSGK